MDMFIVGFSGQKDAGKTTAGKHLEDRWGFYRMSYADPIKEATLIIGNWTPEYLEKPKKEEVDPILGKSPREVFQLVGTDLGRDLINPDIWILHMQRRMEEAYEKGIRRVVIDDVRFLDEAEAIRSWGGIVIGLENPEGSFSEDQHRSEKELADNWTEMNDFTFVNHHDMTFFEKLDASLSLWERGALGKYVWVLEKGGFDYVEDSWIYKEREDAIRAAQHILTSLKESSPERNDDLYIWTQEILENGVYWKNDYTSQTIHISPQKIL